MGLCEQKPKLSEENNSPQAQYDDEQQQIADGPFRLHFGCRKDYLYPLISAANHD